MVSIPLAPTVVGEEGLPVPLRAFQVRARFSLKAVLAVAEVYKKHPHTKKTPQTGVLSGLGR